MSVYENGLFLIKFGTYNKWICLCHLIIITMLIHEKLTEELKPMLPEPSSCVDQIYSSICTLY